MSGTFRGEIDKVVDNDKGILDLDERKCHIKSFKKVFQSHTKQVKRF